MVCQNLNVQLQGQRVKLNLYTLLRLFHEYSLPEGLASIAWGTSNKVIPCILTSPPPKYGSVYHFECPAPGAKAQRVKLNFYILFTLFHEYSLPEGRAGIAWGKWYPAYPSPPPHREVSTTTPVFTFFAFRVKLAQSPPMLHTHLNLQVRLKKINGRSLGTFQKATLFPKLGSVG